MFAQKCRIAAVAFVASALWAGPGQTADLARRAAAPTAALTPVAGASLWTGVYGGVHAGYGDGSAGSLWPAAIAKLFGSREKQTDFDGALGGIQLGYLWQRDAWVLGVEADGSWAKLDGRGALGGFREDDESVNYFAAPEVRWLATVRGRLGYAFDRWQVYGTAGAAVTRMDFTIGAGNGVAEIRLSDQNTHLGWTIGGGLDYALTDAIRIGLDYRYLDFGDKTYVFADATNSVPAKIDLDLQQATLRLNYRF